MACFVYVLGSSGKGGFRTYVGWTLNVDRRLLQHNAGKGARSTRGRLWVLLYAEQHRTRQSAMRREWHLKRDRDFRKKLRLQFASKIPVRNKTPGEEPGVSAEMKSVPYGQG